LAKLDQPYFLDRNVPIIRPEEKQRLNVARTGRAHDMFHDDRVGYGGLQLTSWRSGPALKARRDRHG
jgi:hypothetical protein